MGRLRRPGGRARHRMVIGGGGSARVRLARDGRESEARRSARRAETSHFIIRLLAACKLNARNARGAGGREGGAPHTPSDLDPRLCWTIARRPVSCFTPRQMSSDDHTQLTRQTRHMSSVVTSVPSPVQLYLRVLTNTRQQVAL